MTPEEELEQLKANHEELKATVATLEAKKGTPPVERHMAFPSGFDGAGDILEGKLIKDYRLPKPNELSFEELYLARSIFAGRGEVLPDTYEERYLSELAQKRTMTTTGTATGAELIETPILAALWSDMHTQAKVAGLFAPLINMPGKTLDLPVCGDATFYKPAGEGQAVPATDPATAQRQLVACPVKAQVDISDELNQDAVMALIPSIRSKLVAEGGRVLDKVILLADTATAITTNINHHDGTPTGKEDWLLGFEGMVKYCIVTNTGQADNSADLTTLDAHSFVKLMSLLDAKYITNPARLAFISDAWVYLKALEIADFATMEKIGERATLLTGQLGQVYGIPYVATDGMGKACADGMVDVDTTTGNTKGRLLLVHRDMWKVGVRKPIRVATERSEAKGLTSLVATMRVALISFNAAGTYTSLGYNISI